MPLVDLLPGRAVGKRVAFLDGQFRRALTLMECRNPYWDAQPSNRRSFARRVEMERLRLWP